MVGTLSGAAGGGGFCREQVRWATSCVGIVGRGPSILGSCGLSMLSGFAPLELADAPLEVGGHPTCPFRYVEGPSSL